jgi:hypothetical protein
MEELSSRNEAVLLPPWSERASGDSRLHSMRKRSASSSSSQASVGRGNPGWSACIHMSTSYIMHQLAGAVKLLSTTPTLDWVLFGSDESNKVRILAAFTCSLSADVPCLLATKACNTKKAFCTGVGKRHPQGLTLPRGVNIRESCLTGPTKLVRWTSSGKFPAYC